MSRTTTGFNFLEEPELPAPQVTEAQAEEIAAAHFAIRAHATSLGSQQDKNFVIRGADGDILGVLKIANPAFNAAELGAQDLAAQRIAKAEPSLRIAVPLPNLAGENCTRITGLLDGTAFVRLLRFLPGGTLLESGYLSPTAVAGLGDVAGRVSRALAGFSHPGLDRILQWDLRYGTDVVAGLISHVADPSWRARLQDTAEQAWGRISPIADRLPQQAVHLDLTDANVVVSGDRDGTRRADGVIDFGDLAHTWAVSELAITVSSVLHHAGAEPASVLAAVRAFHSIRPLSATEVEALWPLVVLRTAVLIVSDAQQAAIDPANEYVTAQAHQELRMFEQATAVPIDVMTALLKAELGFATSSPDVAVTTTLIAGLDPASVVTLDLSPESDALDSGAWLDTHIEDKLAGDAVHNGAALVVTQFGEPRLSRAGPLGEESPEVVPTGISIWPASPTRMVAPWDGEVVDRSEDSVTIRGRDYELTVAAVGSMPALGARLGAGDVLADAEPHHWVEVGVRPVGAPPAPLLTRPELAKGWLALSRNPRTVLGLPPVGADRAEGELLVRRDNSFAQVQEHYYREPPQIERGWRHFLVSTAGRPYLDMVNNVTVLGHAHPRVAETAARQLRKLNTNSRFNYQAVVQFSERLTATLPDPLDTVFLVNSGSEASDLALRLAMAATGRRDVVAVREAYHGWTYATDAVSTSVADNPNALATRPDWVHIVESPNSFRGKYRGDAADRYAVEAVQQIEGLTAEGRAPAAFISETVYGNAGGMALPDHYLEQVYAAVHSGGGVAIADEVQVGYGRLGEWFWGFQQQRVVPDIVSIAKATGNGYPVGAVITSRAVADRFRTQGYFFSSTGGSPLSCAIGVTVLDVLRDEALPQNAARVGAHLKARLQALQENHPIIGTVHGMGLYLGVEMIRDPETLEPATEETSAICDRMLELGVIIQPTGDHMNILKTKPPLCIDIEAADFYVDALDRVLTEGW
jgi:4-aminobutyrate aminotransferase-like enzyme/Ser/Thr protein kinase RdoA (MazF antagonist)